MMVGLFRPSAFAPSLAEIDLDDLQARGIAYLILDLDNTICQWQRLEIPDEVAAWISDAAGRGMKLCIASNTRNTRRLNDISGRLQMPAISRALKPRRKGFGEAMKLISADKAKTAVIGDQLLTDIFGGNRAGLYTILVSPMHPREFIGTKVSRVFEWALLFWFRRKGLLGTKAASLQSERKERA
jgi:HAD superfamily phosphatase (TIGR01668 family)